MPRGLRGHAAQLLHEVRRGLEVELLPVVEEGDLPCLPLHVLPASGRGVARNPGSRGSQRSSSPRGGVAGLRGVRRPARYFRNPATE